MRPHMGWEVIQSTCCLVSMTPPCHKTRAIQHSTEGYAAACLCKYVCGWLQRAPKKYCKYSRMQDNCARLCFNGKRQLQGDARTQLQHGLCAQGVASSHNEMHRCILPDCSPRPLSPPHHPIHYRDQRRQSFRFANENIKIRAPVVQWL